MVVIIDCRDKYPRRNVLLNLCMKRDENVRLMRDVWGDCEIDNDRIWTEFEALVGPANLVLLHCGGDQLYAAEALRKDCMQDKACVAYYGGANPHDEVLKYFNGITSVKHALIPEAVPLGLQPQAVPREQKDESPSESAPPTTPIVKLTKCINLIFGHKHEPRGAVEEVYGDPELDKILEGLYKRLTPGADLNTLTKDRNSALDAYYLKRRGW